VCLSVLSYINWSVSPFIYEGEYFAIGWYGTLWVLGLLGMLITLLLTFKRDGVPQQYALITFMIALVCVIFFGHLFQGLFYEWYYTADSPLHLFATDWHYRNRYFEHPWKFFDFAHGGFASHGVLAGVLVAAWILAKLLKCNYWYVADRTMMGVFWLGITVRCGNFINSEIYGIETTLPWGVIFGSDTVASHPTQIYEIMSYLFAIWLAWLLFLRKDGGGYKGLLCGVMFIVVMLCRIVIEFYKLPQMQVESNWLLNMGQLLSIPYAIWAIWLIHNSLEQGKDANIKPFVKKIKNKKNRK